METAEQYKSTCKLFDFLDSIGIKVSSNTWNILTEDHGDLDTCSYCDNFKYECSCDDAPHYHAEYDDEASYE